MRRCLVSFFLVALFLTSGCIDKRFDDVHYVVKDVTVSKIAGSPEKEIVMMKLASVPTKTSENKSEGFLLVSTDDSRTAIIKAFGDRIIGKEIILSAAYCNFRQTNHLYKIVLLPEGEVFNLY